MVPVGAYTYVCDPLTAATIPQIYTRIVYNISLEKNLILPWEFYVSSYSVQKKVCKGK
jgi:hypothetical protein